MAVHLEKPVSTSLPPSEVVLDADLAYREYVAWARMFAIRDAKFLLQTGASLECIEDALRYAADLNDLIGEEQDTIAKLLRRAVTVIAVHSPRSQTARR